MRAHGFLIGVIALAAATTARADDFPAGPMHDLVSTTCTRCHPATQVTSQRKSSEQWADTVTRMIGNGAEVKDSDFDKIVDYLSANYGIK